MGLIETLFSLILGIIELVARFFIAILSFIVNILN